MQSSYNWHLKPTAAWLAWQILSLSLDLQVARRGGGEEDIILPKAEV